MTDAEAIIAVRGGGRCETDTTVHGLSPKEPRPHINGRHHWRAVACDNVTDVIECSECGEQRVARCDFDEEYA